MAVARTSSVRRDLMDEETWSALLAASRVVLHVRNGKIVDQINRAVSLFAAHRGPDGTSDAAQARLPVPAFPVAEPVEDAGDLDFWNGFGGFARNGQEYVVRLHGGQSTPHPWINVISNENFGFHISAEGAGFSWSRNSRDYQLTPWSNDPVINRPGEAFYVADVDTGKLYTPCAALSRDPEAMFETRHGLGYSILTGVADTLEVEVTQTVDREKPVKFSQVIVRNKGSKSRRLKVYAYVEWVLGNNGQKSAPFILSRHDAGNNAIFASNPYSIDYSARTAFLTLDTEASGFTTSRREFVGRFGSAQAPQAIVSGNALSGSTEVDGDPCAALMQEIHLKPGEERHMTFILGDADNAEEAEALVKDVRRVDFQSVLEESKAFWTGFTGQLQVSTPDAGFNHMVNNWLPYQALACRILARTAFYQSSGAFGFRDQLQDTLAFLLYQPDLARKQILRAAGRQFPEGDVQHWWLPLTGAGVRTTISDDVVWLAYAINQYVSATGDITILDESIPS